ncbi:MAG: hypothetical protein V1690_00615 [Candidatus Moraniibacteriota bacterium]
MDFLRLEIGENGNAVFVLPDKLQLIGFQIDTFPEILQSWVKEFRELGEDAIDIRQCVSCTVAWPRAAIGSQKEGSNDHLRRRVESSVEKINQLNLIGYFGCEFFQAIKVEFSHGSCKRCVSYIHPKIIEEIKSWQRSQGYKDCGGTAFGDCKEVSCSHREFCIASEAWAARLTIAADYRKQFVRKFQSLWS